MEFSVERVLRSGVGAVANLFGGQLDAVVGIFGLLDSIPSLSRLQASREVRRCCWMGRGHEPSSTVQFYSANRRRQIR